MSPDTFITAVVPSGVQAAMQKVGDALGIGYVNMFSTGLSISGSAPITHYIASGYAPPRFVNAINNASLDDLYNFVQERIVDTGVTFPYSKAQVRNALGNCDFSREAPFDALARLGLQIVAGPA